MKLTSAVPGFMSLISSGVGARTLKIRSEPAYSSSALAAIRAPDAAELGLLREGSALVSFIWPA
jgi:hypothetical protein